ncbi:hypothetical protein E4T39_08739 [Aureobasidium subglaciale]|nr:hypothetical protein E4T39_08739 [Aureobasidium subglaciale]
MWLVTEDEDDGSVDKLVVEVDADELCTKAEVGKLVTEDTLVKVGKLVKVEGPEDVDNELGDAEDELDDADDGFDDLDVGVDALVKVGDPVEAVDFVDEVGLFADEEKDDDRLLLENVGLLLVAEDTDLTLDVLARLEDVVMLPLNLVDRGVAEVLKAEEETPELDFDENEEGLLVLVLEELVEDLVLPEFTDDVDDVLLLDFVEEFDGLAMFGLVKEELIAGFFEDVDILTTDLDDDDDVVVLFVEEARELGSILEFPITQMQACLMEGLLWSGIGESVLVLQ